MVMVARAMVTETRVAGMSSHWLNRTRLKHKEEKKKQDGECKQEDEQQKQAKAEKRKAEEAAATTAYVVSPMTQIEFDKADPSISAHLPI
jgi:hypothetical protein